MPKQPGNAPESPCGSKDAAEFGRKERHHLNFTGRRTPFQNPATARTAGSCACPAASLAGTMFPGSGDKLLQICAANRSRTRSEANQGAALSTRLPHAPALSLRGYGCHLAPSGHTAAHGLEKQRPSFFFLQFAPVSKVGPGFRPELRSAYSRMRCLPHPRVGKISFPGHAGNGATGALPTGETILGCDPAFSFVLRKRGRRRETVRTDLLHNGGNSGPNRPEAAGDPYPSRKRGTQGLTGGYVGLFRSTRRLVIRWRSVDSSNYSR